MVRLIPNPLARWSGTDPRGFSSSGVLVSFPHYFLSATGHLAEQLKTREWIVARITSITEQVVDHKVSLIFRVIEEPRVIDTGICHRTPVLTHTA